jgi:hypothetical protein
VSGVPGWLSLASEQGERLVDQASVSPEIWRQYEGCGWSLPTPSVRYDIESMLYVVPPHRTRPAMELSCRQPNFQKLIDEFYARALEALRALTGLDEFVLALDCWSGDYLFWPHQAVDAEPWPLRVPGPEAALSLYSPPDYRWGFLFGWHSAEIFGQSLLDELERDLPELLSIVVAVDGVEVPTQPAQLAHKRRDPRGADPTIEEILFLTGFNYELCPEGPWTPELERLWDTFQRTRDRDDLVKLIVKIEQVLDDQGIDHPPCVRLDDAP